MKILIAGARGQLGADLSRALPDATPLDRTALDLADATAVAKRIEDDRPDAVLNAAAWNQVDLAEDEPEAAFRANAFAPLHLARACARAGALLVHFSTDYVFGGERRTPWREEDPPRPESVYAASKLAGEQLVRSHAPRHVVIRTSGLYGLHGQGGKGGNFVEAMLRLGSERGTVRVVDDQVLAPSFTQDLAAVVAGLVGRWAETRSEDLLGLYHVTNSGETSWFGFAREIFRLAGMDVAVEPISSREFGAKAARPAYSVLAPGHLERLGVVPPRSWREALEEYFSRRTGT